MCNEGEKINLNSEGLYYERIDLVEYFLSFKLSMYGNYTTITYEAFYTPLSASG